MKLVDILARELKVWPETTRLAQDSNGHVFGWTGFPNWDGDQWLIDVGASLDKCRPGEMDLADDHMTSSVTRAEWQAAVDALNAPKVVEWDGYRNNTDGNDLRNQALKDLEYNPETGVLIWKENKHKRFIGREAGSVNHHGYRRMHILNTRIDAHRLVWLMHYGCLPVGEVDHINGNKLDNRLVNLRLADKQKNQQNVGVRADSRLGVKGVRIRPSGKYQARVSLTDGARLVKTFEFLDSAVAWLSATRKESHGEFARDAAEQVAAEEREKGIQEICATLGWLNIRSDGSAQEAAILYDAGYRKQVAK